MGQSREVSRTRDDSPDKRPTSSNDQLPAKKQVHWLDGRNDGQIVSHETARTSSPERGRDRTPEHLQNDQPVSPDASSRRDSSPFRASAQKVFDGLLKEMKPEKPQVQKNSEMIQMSGTIERDRDEIKTGEKLEEEMEYHRGLFDNMRQKETKLLEIDKI